MLAKQSLDGATWVLSHRLGLYFSLHNHPLSEDLSAHPAHRYLTRGDSRVISSLAAARAAPREIRT